MAITKTLVFSNVAISNGATGGNTNNYPLHLTESAEAFSTGTQGASLPTIFL